MSTFAAIAWDPEIRNILALSVGVIILCGSVYLLIGTNVGARVGLLVALACLFGWLAIMGLIWWMYGIGMKGADPSWQVTEINTGDLTQAANEQAQTLPEPDQLPDPAEILADRPDLQESFPPPTPGAEPPVPTLGQLVEVDPSLREELNLAALLGGWELLDPSDPQRGEAQAAADTALGPDGEAIFESTSDYKVIDAYSLGGKPQLDEDANTIERVRHEIGSMFQLRHPTHYAVVQVQAVVPQETEPGEPAPTPEVDEDAPVISVIMVRDLGDRRFPAAMTTIVFGILFGLTCNTLHRRDKLVARNLAITG